MNTARRSVILRPGQFRWAICDCCDGSGTRGNPAFSNGITSSEWAEWDEDDRDDYMAGRYDVACGDCGGSGKVKQPIPGRLDFSQLRILAEQRRDERIQAESDRDYRAEQRHCGYEC